MRRAMLPLNSAAGSTTGSTMAHLSALECSPGTYRLPTQPMELGGTSPVGLNLPESPGVCSVLSVVLLLSTNARDFPADANAVRA